MDEWPSEEPLLDIDLAGGEDIDLAGPHAGGIARYSGW
jgi:hypothetical protein